MSKYFPTPAKHTAPWTPTATNTGGPTKLKRTVPGSCPGCALSRQYPSPPRTSAFFSIHWKEWQWLPHRVAPRLGTVLCTWNAAVRGRRDGWSDRSAGNTGAPLVLHTDSGSASRPPQPFGSEGGPSCPPRAQGLVAASTPAHKRSREGATHGHTLSVPFAHTLTHTHTLPGAARMSPSELGGSSRPHPQGCAEDASCSPAVGSGWK